MEGITYDKKEEFLTWIADESLEGFSISSKLIIVVVDDLLRKKKEVDNTEEGLKQLKNEVSLSLIENTKLPIEKINLVYNEETKSIVGDILTSNQKVIQFVFKKEN